MCDFHAPCYIYMLTGRDISGTCSIIGLPTCIPHVGSAISRYKAKAKHGNNFQTKCIRYVHGLWPEISIEIIYFYLFLHLGFVVR